MESKKNYRFRKKGETESQEVKEVEEKVPEVTIYLEDIYESQEYIKIKETLEKIE